MRKIVSALVATVSMASAMIWAPGAAAQEWPARPLTMINPFAAGGPNDVLAAAVRATHG